MNYVASGYIRSGYIRQDDDTIGGVTFDRYGKHICIKESVTRIDLADIYSRSVDWLAQDENLKTKPPMRYTGCDPIPSGFTGTTFFMTNGWMLVFNPNTTQISGVLFSEDYDTGYWSYNRLPLYPIEVSAVVNTVYKETGTSGLTTEESTKLNNIPTAQDIWDYVDRTLTASTTSSLTDEQNKQLMNVALSSQVDSLNDNIETGKTDIIQEINTVPTAKQIAGQVWKAEDNDSLKRMYENIDMIADFQAGDWEIKDNKMIFYSRDKQVMAEYALKNKFGNPSESTVFKREKL